MGSEMNRNSPQLHTRRTATIAIAFVLFAAGFLLLRRQFVSPANVQARPSLQLTSTSFASGAAIPPKYTCDGADVSPSLAWSAVPATAKSFALVLHDPDASVDFTHWIAYDIPASVHDLGEGASNDGAMPQGSSEGVNDFRRLGYGGPCPPPGNPHHYTFLLYALNTDLNLHAGATREQLDSAMQGHIVAQGQLVGLYQRGGE